ncbi:TPA: hypothetical protein NJ458_003387 [Vibrio parahaemolyticus]|uniref:hypothetical protein n=1 Tax=Vibrio parahaemolyticus TaxID=670 RepID=UPI000D38AC36|nr:hypothetical protein [Vibrio parahaemolyticus]EGU0167922.1 hypothetical protein [Vibrio parahaemolyticus]EHH1170551.1 hypothetical protein [Vibrio parahaemolyticus]EHR0228829.1 hypothetical protein [Vibrio parahaemolyticus]ELA9391229.1 hypothetical protein [Vibrio parahaemolyticus]MBE4110912.1 hypothetical protein [Vibrio parahaemolyticus]
MKRRIFLLSGGLDSVAALTKLASDPSLQHENIRVFHVEYVNRLSSLPQKNALRQAMLHTPDWDLYIHRTESTDLKYPIDVCTKAMLAFGTGNFLEGELAGETPDELELIVGYEYEEADTTTIDELNEAIQLIRKAYVRTGIGVLPTTVVSYISDMDKAALHSIVGDGAYWSCDYPSIQDHNLYKACGTCDTCKQLKKYGIEHPEMRLDYSLMATKWGLGWS